MHRLMLRWPCPNTSCPPTSKTPATPNLICGPVQICWHKFGLAPLGVGWVIWRDAQCLPEGLSVDVRHLGGDVPTFGLNCSRPGGQIVAGYCYFIRWGEGGRPRVPANCLSTPDLRQPAMR